MKKIKIIFASILAAGFISCNQQSGNEAAHETTNEETPAAAGQEAVSDDVSQNDML